MATLLFKLSIKAFLEFKASSNFKDRLSLELKLKTRLWYACLACFIKELQNFVNFSPTLEQQKEILFHVTRIAILAEKEFDSGSSILTSKNFRDVILERVTNNNVALFKIVQQISSSVRRIKELIPNNPHYDDFLENIIKTWETHRVRDVKECNTSVSKSNAVRCSEDRGGLYFLALVFALSPKNLTDRYQRAIYFCGAWFQITDDYSDRKKDLDIKNTPFTIDIHESPEKIFEECKTKYQHQIKTLANDQNALVKFMEKLCALLLRSPF